MAERPLWLIWITLIQMAVAAKPRLCQTQSKGQYFRLSQLQSCSDIKMEKVTVQMETVNIKMYRTKGRSMTIVDKHCVTNEDFFGQKRENRFYKYRILPPHLAAERINDKNCIDYYGKKTGLVNSYHCQYNWMKSVETVTTSCSF